MFLLSKVVFNWLKYNINSNIIAKVISFWEYDTEDWNNDAENSTLLSQACITFYNILK